MKDVGIVTESASLFRRGFGAFTRMGFSFSLSNVSGDEEEGSDDWPSDSGLRADNDHRRIDLDISSPTSISQSKNKNHAEEEKEEEREGKKISQ